MATKKKKTDAAPAKSAEPARNKPTLVQLLAAAGKAYGQSIQNLQRFAETYVMAVELYGAEAKKEFYEKFPHYTPSMWSRCEQIGKHNLLPHFWLASGSFVAGLLRLEKSMEKQMNLVGAMKDGKIETIDNRGKIVLRSLDDLSRLEELGIVFAISSETSAAKIREFAYRYRKEWQKSSGSVREDYEKVGDLLRINHAMKKVNRADWAAMGRLMGWTA